MPPFCVYNCGARHIVVTGGGDMRHILPVNLRSQLMDIPIDWDNLREIRMRCERPVIFRIRNNEYFLDKGKGLTEHPAKAYCVNMQEIQECLAYICQYSLYAFENQIQNGYITVRGGHRVGLSGQVVMGDRGVYSMPHFSSLNIRMAHSVQGCGEGIFPYLWKENQRYNTLIVSPPGHGKSTLLRDLVRLFSDGYQTFKGQSVGLVDERFEIAACYQGIPQMDVGMRTDILANCTKAMGVEMMVRSMAPNVIAFDELGSEEDIKAVKYAVHSGCTVVTTLHGSAWEDVMSHLPKGIFDRIIFLNDWIDNPRGLAIVDGNGVPVYKAG